MMYIFLSITIDVRYIFNFIGLDLS